MEDLFLKHRVKTSTHVGTSYHWGFTYCTHLEQLPRRAAVCIVKILSFNIKIILSRAILNMCCDKP